MTYDQTQPERNVQKETEGGYWIKRDADIHRCNKPGYDRTVKRYDVWECGTCHKEWIVASVDSDQREGSTWIRWVEHEVWKSTPFPRGTK